MEDYTPGTRCTEKSRHSTSEAGIRVPPTREVENRSNPPEGEGAFVSDILDGTQTYFTLYSQGLVNEDQVDDFVEAWHESGDEETQSLAEYLGMTDEEYGVWFITPRLMPSILAARRSGRPLQEFVRPFFEQLRKAGDPKDAPVLHTLGYWLRRHPCQPPTT